MNNNRNGRQSNNRGQYSGQQYNRSSSGSQYSARRQQNNNNYNKSKDSNVSVFMVMTLAVIVIAVIFIALAIAMLNSGTKKNNNDVSSDVSPSMVSQTDIIVGFDENESSEAEVYSDTTHPIFQGTWRKTNVYENQKATLTIGRQDNESFDFTLQIWAGEKTSSISGTASYTGENSAVFKKGSASITFDYGTKYLSVYHSGKNSALGFSDNFTIDGKFTTGEPNYYKEEETNNYDYNVYKSDAVVNALKSTLSADDYSLYNEMMSTGLMSPIPYERTVDKNGKKVNVDTELKCVKYYASIGSLGMNMIMMCSNSGKIYVLFYDTEEMRYYTNDKNYSSKMPASFQTTADSKGMTPIFK